MELAGRVVVVTGGGSGIGAAMCRRFADEGPQRLVVADLDEAAAQRIATEVGGRPFTIDVGERSAIERLVASVESDAGHIDLFASNAGIGGVGGVETDPAVWQRTWDVNVMAHVHAANSVLPRMLSRGEGYLLNTASAAGLLTNIGAAAYSVTKHGAVALAEWLAITYGDRGIKVSCLCPQFVSTALLDDLATAPSVRAWADAEAISAEAVAEDVVAGLRAEAFLILPHAEVADYFAGKANDYDGWLAGMRRLQSRVLPDPPMPGA